jgi:predicted O-methyltransferase YrrM
MNSELVELMRHPSLVPSLLLHGRSGFVRAHVLQDGRKVQRLYRRPTEIESPSNLDFLEVQVRRFQAGFCADSHNSPLYALVRYFRPAVVVETGVHAGRSSAMILRGLADEEFGQLYSIDFPNLSYEVDKPGVVHHDRLPTGLGVGYAIPDELRSRWSLIIGDASVELPLLFQRTGNVDMFFHDSMHTYSHMMMEFRIAWSSLNQGGLLVSDDADWNDSLRDFARSAGVDCRIVNGLGLCVKGRGAASDKGTPPATLDRSPVRTIPAERVHPPGSN